MKKRDYHHKNTIKTNKELHWSSYKSLRNAVSMKLRKKKPVSIQQDLRKLWKTLNKLIPNKKQDKTANAPASENLTATSFNEFFTSVRRIRKKPEVAWKRGLRALRPSRRLAVKTNGCRKKFQDGASKY